VKNGGISTVGQQFCPADTVSAPASAVQNQVVTNRSSYQSSQSDPGYGSGPNDNKNSSA